MSVARSYAKALLEAAVERKTAEGELDRIEEGLRGFSGLIHDENAAGKALLVALVSPATSAKEKAAVVAAIANKAGYPTLLAHFLVLIARKGRLDTMPEIQRAFSRARLESEGGIQGRLVSADPLSPPDVDTLSRAFSKKFGKKVSFEAATDSDLLAGMKVTVNGVTYDGTLRSQLQRLRDRLVYGVTESVH